jgi:hypothetical protein
MAVVVALGIAAVGVRAAAGATLRNAGLTAAAAVGLALLFAILTLTAAAKYRDHVRGTYAATTVEDRLRQATTAFLFVSASLVPVTLLYLHRPVAYKPAPPKPELHRPPRQLPPGGSGVDGLPWWLNAILVGVLIVVGLLVLTWLIALAIRLLRNLPVIEPTEAAELIESQAEDEALADALLAGRSALAGDDTRAAIIACYAAMEASLEQIGITRARSDSPSDLLQRAMTRDLPGTGPRDAVTLTNLFREARFSTHPMTPAQLEAARSALDAVMAVLGERLQMQAVAS